MSKLSGGADHTSEEVDETTGSMTFRRAFAGYYGPTARRSGPIGARTWALTIISAAYWLLAARTSPFPVDIREAVAAGLLITGLVLLVVYLRTWVAFGEKVFEALADRQRLGVGVRILLWFTAWLLYAIGLFVLALGILFLVSN